MKKFIRIPLAMALAGAMLCSCGEKQQVVHTKTEKTEITFSWWGNDYRNEYTMSAIEKFEELHPDIHVKCSYSEWTGFEERNRIRMLSGTEEDVMQINIGWLDEYSSDGNGYFDLEMLKDHIDLSGFDDNMLDYGRKNGVLNALPIAMNAETVYINKSIYDKYGLDVPDTWDDLYKAAEKMRADGVYPLAGSKKSMWLYSIAYAEQTCQKSIMDYNGHIRFNVNELMVMIDFYVGLVVGNVVPKVEDFNKLNIDNGVYAGTVGWISDAMNYYGKAIDNGSEITVAPYTAWMPEKAGSGWFAKPATLYAISRNTEHPQEAAMLMDFLLNSSDMADYQGLDKGVPISTHARNYLDSKGMLKGLQYDAAVQMENNYIISRMDPQLENEEMIESFIEASNLVIYDKNTVAEAALRLFKIYNNMYYG
ncbi:ABC transporter substrate-binding protein [Ruminococcus sp. XPD3002]|uniref:ABC transporter substrate-binding protein n=1 Tax=Ruminococcus sp. XPD3002 TaxID=1452269 RepID=UPI0009125E31|nr:oligogalacturonide transport system substrate-binding protein [Ruminococcus flavefaciens]